MAFRHPLDPEAPYRAIPVLARLVAQGLLRRDEALDGLRRVPVRPGASAWGQQSRLIHALDDAVRAHERQRSRTERAVRRALAVPLAERRPRAQLFAAADAADPDGDLLPRERRAVAKEEVAWLLRALARGGRR